tara:strand:- start:1354 stop:1572 length:219 start_codon:yes stop_codon:yes gene_type:complete
VTLNYESTTDSLYIDLSSKPNSDSREISEGIVLDYDVDGNLTGGEIDKPNNKVDLEKIVLNKVPSEVEQLSA